ncbi:hypothetical protein VNO77_16902 [Canavalia gladiata]|uniref:Uncharacterized protein n=1 Tax=Canavalia gladiata TaxID=3824 RepID=A0AAN9QI80_CANGL
MDDNVGSSILIDVLLVMVQVNIKVPFSFVSSEVEPTPNVTLKQKIRIYTKRDELITTTGNLMKAHTTSPFFISTMLGD